MTAFFFFDAASVSPGAERPSVSEVTVKKTACVNGHHMTKFLQVTNISGFFAGSLGAKRFRAVRPSVSKANPKRT